MEKKIELTRKMIDRIRNDLASVPTTPVGDHLSEDDFIAYSMEQVTAENKKRIDAHLESCEDCLVTMEDLLEANMEWNSEEGKQRIEQQKAALIDAIKNKKSFSDTISDIQDKVVEIILEAKDKISFKGFEGFTGGFQQEPVRVSVALGGKQDDISKIRPIIGMGNDDYHIDIHMIDNEYILKLTSKKMDISVKNISIDIFDINNCLIESIETDSNGEARFES